MFEIPVRHFARYYEMISVFIRYGLGYLFMPGNSLPTQPQDLTALGIRLRRAFTELGPTFVKIGQIASTRPDLLPKPIVQELAKLQDQVQPLPVKVVRRVIETALQAPLESVYGEFKSIPLGSASMGQVHQAVLKTGEAVAVKVRRPLIQETVKTDLEIFQMLVQRLESKTQAGSRYPFRLMLEEFAHTLTMELDFRNEGRHADKLAKLGKGNAKLVIPKIYWEFSHPSVLTMEYIAGTPLHQISGTNGNVRQIADNLCQVIFQQMLQGGFFHADPHPGNVLILPEGKIGLIDFGIVGQLSSAMRRQTLALISGMIRGNYDLIFKTLSQMGIVPDSVVRDDLQKDIVRLRSKHLNVAGKKSGLGESIREFFDIIYRHRIIIPSEYILIGKTLLTLEGALQELDPEFNLIDQAKPFSKGLFWKTLWTRIRNKLGGARETDTTPFPTNIQ